MTDTAQSQPGIAKRLIKFLGPSVVIGFVCGVAIALTANYFDWELGTLIESFSLATIEPTPIIALVVAAIYVIGGAISLMAVAFPQRFYKSVAVSDPDDLIEQRPFYAWQSICALACGMGLIVIVLAEPFALLSGMTGFALFAALMAVSAYGFVRSWKLMDELHRTMSSEAISMGYYLVLTFGGGWAVLGHLGLAAGPGFLDWIVILWTMMLIATTWAMGRRGMLDEVV